MNYWLLKSEPDCFSIQDLENSPGKTTQWDGVRNYQARNFIRNDMRPGDPAFFYHSGRNPAIVGLVTIAGPSRPDPSQWDPENQHYDSASPAESPRWYAVDVRLVEKFTHPLPLSLLKGRAELAGMELLRRGSRLSVQPVTAGQYIAILALTKEEKE